MAGITVVGIGPGSLLDMTPRARAAIERAEVVAGYTTYIRLIEPLLAGQSDKEVIGTGMMQEIDRCRMAVEAAALGKETVVVSSGDAGVYGMAGLVLELVLQKDAAKRPNFGGVIAGVSAVNAAASVLGAPLMHDFAVISLSDLLTPWETICKRAEMAAAGDFVIALYNPKSKKRVQQIEEIRAQVGSKKVLLALSGGVDSSVAAALMAEAIGSQLTCVFVDHGLMRKNEGDEVEAAFGKWDIHFIRVNAEDRFLSKLAGVTDPETKRKIIGEEFIRVFEAEAKKIGAVDYLVQGTIYPDVIESGLGKSAVIKSHHNVGGLPDYVDFKEIIEPLRLLFKDEVRQLGRELGLPEYLVSRQPFPGPGLAIRIMGEITKEKADTLRLADAIYREELEKAGENKKMNQYFAVLTDTRTVGVMGDGRSYDRVLALRAVTTEDFMTADWARIPYELLDKISGRIVNEVKGINRIVYDITSKPPATVEWE